MRLVLAALRGVPASAFSSQVSHITAPILSDAPGPEPFPAATTVVSSYLPEGTVLTPAKERFVQDPELLVHLGKHPETSPEQREQLRVVLGRYKRAFAYSLSDLTGYTGVAGPMNIVPKGDARAFVKPRMLSPLKREIELQKNTELLECNIIERAPFATSAANPTFAEKRAPDGTYTDIRLCYNYRPQNQLTKDQHTSYPIADELFRQIGDCRFFSKIDLRSGFLQIPVDMESRDLTAFWWGSNLFRFLRMPFGLKQAPATFQRIMETELGRAGCLEFAKVFIDDVLIHSRTFEEHLKHIEAVLQCLLSCGLRAHPEKSSFCIDTIDFLGFEVSQYGLTPQEAKVQALMELPHPKNLDELRVSLGKLRYYGCFCPDFSSRARPLLDLLAKDVPWKWDPAVQGAAFDEIRGEIATEGKVLRRFDPVRPIYVHSDFSNRGLGAVLGQVEEEGREYMVACISRSLNKHERNYSSYKGECLAAVWACRVFRPYVHGLRFTLVTDHQPLKWLLTAPNLEGVMARWACILQEFDVEIVHRAGVLHMNADALSRFPRADNSDQSGARLDHEVPPLEGPREPKEYLVVAALLSKPEHGYKPFHPIKTVGAPDRVTKVAATVQLDTRTLSAAWSAATTGKGVTLYEPCGGLCAGLEAVLRNGVPIRRYLYSDVSESAQWAAVQRAEYLASTYPHLLPRSALTDTLTALPMDIEQCTPAALIKAGARDRTQWLVIAGPECKDFSPAGLSKGREGKHARTMDWCLQIIGALQQLQPTKPPLYLVENAAMQHNFRSAKVREVDFPAVCGMFGSPTLCDAVVFGAYAHRLRNYWQNMVRPYALMKAVAAVQRPVGLAVDNILDPGRHSTAVERTDSYPFPMANRKGMPRSALPTLVAYEQSRAFREGRAGSIYDSNVGRWTEPNPDERERALGYPTGATAGCGLTREDRHILTGNCMDQSALTGLLRLTLQSVLTEPALSKLVYTPVHIRPAHVQPVVEEAPPQPQHDPALSVAAFQLALAVEVIEQAEAARADSVAEPALVDGPGTSDPGQPGEEASSHVDSPPHVSFKGQRRLAKRAAEPGEVDIHMDTPTLGYLTGTLKAHQLGLQISMRRVLKRARGYRCTAGPDGRPLVLRLMANGTTRMVPHPSERSALIQRAHNLGGHFGARRTSHLLLGQYWWKGVLADVTAAVKACDKCDRARASFNIHTPSLTSHSIDGLFYCWGVDTSGPYPTSRRGNKYIFHAIEYFSGLLIAEPMPSKESRDTSYVFRSCILARFGGCAQVITDNGTEYQGAFRSLLVECGIDHRNSSPNHPQTNGLVERTVGTIKRALRKHCELELNIHTWDVKLPMIVLAYNCSAQASTRMSPYHLLYAREPVFPSGTVQHAFSRPVIDSADPRQQAALADDLLMRAKYLSHVVPLVANNLAIAHHRDTLRYAKTRSGSYLPRVRTFADGDFVYLRRRNKMSGLQIEAKAQILRVHKLKSGGTVILQGKCGGTRSNHVSNLAPCHLPFIDGTVDPSLAMPPADMGCEVCQLPDNADVMVVCDVCGTGWHTYCTEPPLPAVPAGDFICPTCTEQGIRSVPSRSALDPRSG